MDWFDDWALTLAVFVPLVGMALVLMIPKAQETAIKTTALVTALVDSQAQFDGSHRPPGSQPPGSLEPQ